MTASAALFGGLILIATVGAAAGAVLLAALIIADWRGNRLW